MALFGTTIFAGAFLLFLVQPLLGKFILPWFGGSPSVWTTCMLFFQVLLLGGYLYAHRLSSRLGPRRQALVHAALLAASLLSLPILPGEQWKPAGDAPPVRHILGLLAASVGGVYFLLSSTAPLLQSWFTRLSTASPYRLYSLSNLGSLLAILLYPVLLEPTLSVRMQAALWTGGYVAFAVLSGLCALRLARGSTALTPTAVPVNPPDGSPAPEPPSAADRTLWLILPACGSLMLLASTNQICMDVAVVPLLWVLPLALYLLSFVLCFQGERWYSRVWAGPGLAVLLVVTCAALEKGVWLDLRLQILCHAAMLFASCMVCHGELARLKPHARHLTLFYGMLAAGGALGGAVVTLLAPLVFRGYWEYQLGLVAVPILFLVVLHRDRTGPLRSGRPFWAWAAMYVAVAALAGFLASHIRHQIENSVTMTRSFFGALRVLEENSDDPEHHRFTLLHGRIEHGFQFTSTEKRYWPTSYFGPDSGAGLAIRFHPRRASRPVRNLRIGVVGLGTGTIATYGEAGDLIRFYELNPDVLRLCNRYFTYLSNSAARVDVRLGDGRISLENERARGESGQFDILAVDAFSSDAIPAHLLTREGFEIFRYHLKEDGILAFNISNRYLNLRPVVRGLAGLAASSGMTSIWVPGTGNTVQETDDSDWVLLTRNRPFLATPEMKVSARSWAPDEPEPVIWTDDFSNLFRLIRHRE